MTALDDFINTWGGSLLAEAASAELAEMRASYTTVRDANIEFSLTNKKLRKKVDQLLQKNKALHEDLQNEEKWALAYLNHALKLREHAGPLVAYLAEEEKDYRLKGKPENHIWLHVEALKELLEKQV